MSTLSRLIKRSVLISSLLVFGQQLLLIQFSFRASTTLEPGIEHLANLNNSLLAFSAHRSVIEQISAVDWWSGAGTIALLSVLISLVAYAVLDTFHKAPVSSSMPWAAVRSAESSSSIETEACREKRAPLANQLRPQQTSKQKPANGSRPVVAA